MNYRNILVVTFIFAISAAYAQSQPDDIPDINITPILVNGLLGGASQPNQQLLTDPALASGVDLFRTTLDEIVSYNLNATENLSLSAMASCATEPLTRSRRILDNYRDQSFVCLQALRADLDAFVKYSFCLFDLPPLARADIDALKPAIDACVAANPMPAMPMSMTG